MTPAPEVSRVWLTAGIALVVAGAAGLLGGNAWWLIVGPRPVWHTIPGMVLGVLGFAAAFAGWSRPERGALVAAAVGLVALVLDFLGLSGPPRVIGGAALLAGAAVTFGSSRPAARWAPLASVAAAVGLGAHALVGLLLLPLGLVAPPWAVIALLVAWAALLALAVRQRGRPLVVLVAPAATATLAAGLLYVGGTFFGWTL
jgi:hypothetical protein